MTQTEVTPNPILEAARKLQEAKLVAVQGVVDTRSRIDAVVSQLTAAQREDAVAYQKALKAGWTEAELRQVGIAPPARKPPGRPRGAQVKSPEDYPDIPHPARGLLAGEDPDREVLAQLPARGDLSHLPDQQRRQAEEMRAEANGLAAEPVATGA